MPATITIRDESTSGESLREFDLEFLTERITVRELIRSRVFQEVKDYHAQHAETFQGLVQPTNAERALNGDRRTIDWQDQYQTALRAFEATRVIVLLDERQLESLDEEIVISPGTTVTFLKLVPLVGG